MVNINHVNRYYFLRVLCFPLFGFSYLFKYLSCWKLSKKYVLGSTDVDLKNRYGKLISLVKANIKLQNHSFSFFLQKKLLQNQTIFIINKDLEWFDLVLLRQIVDKYKHPIPRFLLNNLLIKKKPSILWDLIDTFYGINDFELAISSKRSFIVEKTFLEKNPSILKVLKCSYLPIVPIAVKKNKRNSKYILGKSIKMSSLINFNSSALYEFLSNAFNELENMFFIFNQDNKKSKFKLFS